MKKICLILALLLVFSVFVMVSCSDNNDTDNSTSSSSENKDNEEPRYAGEYLELSAMDLTPFIKLGQYKDFTLEVEKTAHNEEDVQKLIQKLIDDNTPDIHVETGTVERGDMIGIDYEGYMNDVLFNGGSAKGQEIVADDKNSGYIEGFADGLIGANVGDTVTLDLHFPNPYPNSPDKAGQPVKFLVTVNYIVKKDNPPELNDEFVKKATNNAYNTVDELRNYYAESIDKEISNQNKLLLCETLLEKCEFPSLPQKHVDFQYYQYADELTEIAKYFEMTFEDFVGSYTHLQCYYMGYVSSFFESIEKMKEASENMTKEELFLCAVAQAENITVSDEEYNNYLSDIAKQYDNQFSTQVIEEGLGKAYLKQMILYPKVQQFLDENNRFELALEW